MYLENTAKCLKYFRRVYVSTDSPDIIRRAEWIGAKGILRPMWLCGDTPNIPVYKHALSQMKDADILIAVQVNSPNIDPNLIAIVKHLMLMGVDEVMTCDKDYKIYGSIWAITREKLENYGDPYKPTPHMLLVDESIDIHTDEDYQKALSLI